MVVKKNIETEKACNQKCFSYNTIVTMSKTTTRQTVEHCDTLQQQPFILLCIIMNKIKTHKVYTDRDPIYLSKPIGKIQEDWYIEQANKYLEDNYDEVMSAYKEHLVEMWYTQLEWVRDWLESFVLDYYLNI